MVANVDEAAVAVGKPDGAWVKAATIVNVAQRTVYLVGQIAADPAGAVVGVTFAEQYDMALLGTTGLVEPDAMVEIIATAAVPD